jgi:excinuclease ABC subunit C
MSSRDPENDDRDALRDRLAGLPDSPGVYLHKDAQGKVLYVGKAVRLATRVRSYFQDTDKDPKTAQLVRRIADVDYIVTRGETEALVLEDQLIKEYRPRYNIRLKDDKRYPYLRITLQEPFPRVEVVRRLADDGSRCFGPYTSVRAMRETLQHALRIFQVRTCELDLPRQTVPRPCLDWQIGRCSAPCVGYDDAVAYRRKVAALVRFLEGEDASLVAELKAEMADHAATRRYEEAARVRDRLRVLETTLGALSPIHGLSGDLDACAVARDGARACGIVLRIRRGRVMTSHEFHFEDRLESGTPAFLEQLLREYYPRAGDLPPLVLLDHDLADREAWAARLTDLRGRPVKLVRPQRGPKREAVAMAAANALHKLEARRLKDLAAPRRAAPERSAALQAALDLHALPETIECFDISNFQGRETVASLVYFRDGQPLKSRYRRFRIRTVDGIDDFASLREVLRRYYARLLEKGLPPADLVLIDGGAGQVGAARAALTELGLHAVELIGLAKREELIVRERGLPPLRLPRTSGALQLLQQVRDEAHRFAITYHRLLREQRTTGSVLDAVPGIGRVKKLSLLHHFASVDDIRRASAQELSEVRGLGVADVERLLSFFAAERREGA